MLWNGMRRSSRRQSGRPQTKRDPSLSMSRGNGASSSRTSRRCALLVCVVFGLSYLLSPSKLTAHTDIKALKQFVLARLKGEKLTDDKTMIMERIIQLAANLPNDSKLRAELTNTFGRALELP